VFPAYEFVPLNVKVPPPDFVESAKSVSAPESVMLNGLPFVSAALNVMLPVSLVNVIGSDDDQFASAPTVPPEKLMELLNVPCRPVKFRRNRHTENRRSPPDDPFQELRR